MAYFCFNSLSTKCRHLLYCKLYWALNTSTRFGGRWWTIICAISNITNLPYNTYFFTIEHRRVLCILRFNYQYTNHANCFRRATIFEPLSGYSLRIHKDNFRMFSREKKVQINRRSHSFTCCILMSCPSVHIHIHP